MNYALITEEGTIIQVCNSRLAAVTYQGWFAKKGIELTIKLI